MDSTRASRAALWLVAEERSAQSRRPPDPPPTERTRVAERHLAAYVSALAPARCWPIRYEGELLGVVAVSTPPGVALASAESRLLDDLAHHAGLLVANARLTVDLAHELEVVATRAAELKASRQQVVRAQDVQRHRLEADIHDGAQQLLVALLVELGVLQRSSDEGRRAGAVGPATDAAVLDQGDTGAAGRRRGARRCWSSRVSPQPWRMPLTGLEPPA